MQKQPIDNVVWTDTDKIKANDYNPNVVLNQELALLKFSLLHQGWIQPILVSSKDNEIIDGYHRWWLCTNDKEVRAMTNGQVPVVFFDMDEADRMCLTIRINRAKGNHIAYKMHEIVYKLHNQFGMTLDEIGEQIGANKKEVELLMAEGVFAVKDTKHHQYSKAWKPVLKKEQ